MTVIRLQISTWIGTSSGAQHYYGKLWAGFGEYYYLMHTLSEHEAAETNKFIRRNFSDDYYRMYEAHPGDLSQNFNNKEAVIDFAKRACMILFPGADRLEDYDTGEVYSVFSDVALPMNEEEVKYYTNCKGKYL